MKGQLFLKTILLLVCSLFVASTFAQDDPPTLPNDPEGITDFLPLTLVSFSAAVQGSGSTELSWNTANEVNVSNFTVQKSTDGKDFITIGTVLAGNKSVNSYSFTDISSVEDIAYYRLKMIDKDGTFKYSFVVFVKGKAISRLILYPNPAVGNVTVTHGLPQGKASLTVINITGNRLQTVIVNSTAQQTSFTLSNVLKLGNYIIQYADEAGTKNIYFTKQ